MNDFFSKNLELMFSGFGMNEIVIKTGDLAGVVVKGMFQTNHRQRTIMGFLLETDGPCFFCPTKTIKGLTVKDILIHKGIEYKIATIRSDHVGLSVIETKDLNGKNLDWEPK